MNCYQRLPHPWASCLLFYNQPPTCVLIRGFNQNKRTPQITNSSAAITDFPVHEPHLEVNLAEVGLVSMKMQLGNGIKKQFNFKYLSDLLIWDCPIGFSCQRVKPMCSTDVCLLRKTVTMSWTKKSCSVIPQK